MLLTDEELAVITLKSPFVYEYGDMPHFKRCLNEFPLQFFARYRASRDDPSQHRWSRILGVVDRHSGSAASNDAHKNNNNNNSSNANTNDGDGEGGERNKDSRGAAPVQVAVDPLKWKEKHFFIALRMEGEDKCVELPRLSSKLPTMEEVTDYCARRAESQLRSRNTGVNKNNNSDDDSLDGVTARSELPSAQEIAKMKAFRQNHIVHHQWTPDEVEEVRRRNERIGRVGVGSAPVRLTVTSLHNMRLETELGIASSRHATGHSAAAMERRTELSTATFANDAGSQGSFGRAGAVSLADRNSPTPPTAPPLSQEMCRRWEESKQEAEQFYAYVSNEDRSAYMKKIVKITQSNYEQNKRDRLLGIANEKRLRREGNLLESGGLWIVDDRARAELALKYKMEQDGEMAVAVGRDGEKKNTSAPKEGGKDTGAETAARAPLREEDVMLERFMTHRKAQELSFASVPEEFMSISNTDAVDAHDDAVPRHPPVTQSPKLLVMHADSRFVVSQLPHTAARSVLRRRPFFSTACVPSGPTAARDEPPKTKMRHI